MKWRARAGEAGDEGLTLIEVLVALLILSIVSISAAVVFVGSLRTTSEQSAKQRAISVATRALEVVQSVPVSQVLVGRKQADVQALVASPTVAPLVTNDILNTGNFDASAGSSAVPTVPLNGSETLDSVAYRTATAINGCYLSKSSGNCSTTQGTDGVKVLRATVSVTWGDATCRKCSYATSALLDNHTDPVFKLAQSRPIIQTVTPSSAYVGSTHVITVVGADFESGSTVALATGGGSLTNMTRSADGTSYTATWQASTATGSYVLSVTNPDNGRAEFSVTVGTTPEVTDDCTASVSGYYNGDSRYPYWLVRPQVNDVPGSGGTLTFSNIQVNGGTNGSSSDGNGAYYYLFPNGSGVFTVDYTLNVNNVTSRTARMTFRVNSGSCPS